MGLSADGSNKAFPSADVDAFIARKRIDITNDAFFRMDAYSEHHVIVAVDPSGGGSSQFAVCSILQLANGIITVRAAASFPSARPATSRSTRG